MAVKGIPGRILWAVLAWATAIPAAAQPPPDELKTFMAGVGQAADIADPYQRCLHTPDLPGSQWHAQGVTAYCAFANEPTLTATRFRELIAAGKGAEVDHAFASYLDTQQHDPAHAGRLYAAIRRTGIRTADPKTRDAIDAWMQQRPHSAFAMAASAIQYHEAALDARGLDFASMTTHAQMQNMQALAEQARKTFDRAATMKPAVPTMYGHMFATGALLGDGDYASAALKRGLALEPASLSIRLTMANMTGEKWGGSTAMVDQQGKEAAALAVRHPLLWQVVGRVAIADATGEGFHGPFQGNYLAAASEVSCADDLVQLAALAYQAGNKDQALILAAEALRFDNGNWRALYFAAKTAPVYGYKPWLHAVLLAAAQDHPESIDVARISGGYLALHGDVANGERLLRTTIAARPDDEWAIVQLADLYAHEGKQPDDALRLVDDLVQRRPDYAPAYAVQARLLIGRNDPRRYAAIHYFLDHFGKDPANADQTSEFATYLASHPEDPTTAASPSSP